MAVLYCVILDCCCGWYLFISKKNVCASSLNQQDTYISFLWLDMVITSSESGQRLLVTIWFYCVSGFATSVVNCGTTRV
jgi:hypothetical protein